jgi:hypothetical protein
VKIPTTAKIASLAPVGIGVVALTQMHYLVSHFATIGLIGGAVTYGASLLIGKAKGRGKDAPEVAPEPTVDQKIAALADQLGVLPQSSQSSLDERLAEMRRRAQVIDYTAAGQAVQRVTRKA